MPTAAAAAAAVPSTYLGKYRQYIHNGATEGNESSRGVVPTF